MKRTIFIILGALLLSACGVIVWQRQAPGPMMDPSRIFDGAGSFDSNGERIYFTARNKQGERITYSGGTNPGGMMMGQGALTCASCHGSDARGGRHTMHMDVMDAPDIRFSALSGEDIGHGDEGDDHNDDHGSYDLETFRQAVIDGKHPDGDPLNRDMPRWRMSDSDLADLFAFLKSLP